MYKNLEIIRKIEGLTINDMSELISKTPATYYKKETGKVSITVKEAIIISRRLNKTVEFLFAEVEQVI